jgi:DNA-binding LacI/PurR family transcriptional regulator
MRRSELERRAAATSNGSAVTLEMVAKEAGVSPSTVSRILNGTARVREAKVRAVEAAIAKLQFMPNPVARSLARGRSMSIGVVTQAIDSPFYGEALASIEMGLASARYSALFVSGHWREGDERRCVADLLSRRVDGIIRSAMTWDVMGGVARRNCARNPNAMTVAAAYNRSNPNGDQITIPYLADADAVSKAVAALFEGEEGG